jgi:hypothetical protein
MSKIAVIFPHPMTMEALRVPIDVFNIRKDLVFRRSVDLTYIPTTLEDDFAPGTYLIRAIFPSGEIVCKTTVVGAQDEKLVVLQSQRRSPRETLGFAYYARPAVLQPVGVETRDFAKSFLAKAVPVPETKFWIHNHIGSWAAATPVDTGASIYDMFGTSGTEEQANAGILLAKELTNFDWRKSGGQLWLQVRYENYSRIVALPVASANTSFVVIRSIPEAKDRAPFRILVSTGNYRVQSLLGYLSTGDFESARLVGSDWASNAEEMLQEKNQDPIGATVAGYFLLRAGELSRLHDWTRNLANRFAWLPDGPVIRAWHLIYDSSAAIHASGDDTIDAPREMLLAAAQRGLPYFSIGVRMLYDGLNVLALQARGEDRQVNGALHSIRPYVTAAIWQSSTTYFAGEHPNEPSLIETKNIASVPVVFRSN